MGDFDSVLDLITKPEGWGQLLGLGGMGDAPKPPTPPPPPPQVMANAPQSFAPNSSFDGGGLQPPNFNQRFAGGPEEPPAPMPPPLPPQRAQGGAFGGMGGKPVGWDSGAYDPPGGTTGQGGPMPYADAQQPQGGVPQEMPPAATAPTPPPPMAPGPNIAGSNLQSQVAWPGVRGAQAPQNSPIINRTSRNAPADGPDMSPAAAMRRRDEGTQSLDEMELDRRGGGPPPTNILPGGLAASLGATTGQRTPEPQRSRTLSNALMGFGKGLSAVGQLRPGTTGGASFAAGAGGALEGSGQHEDKQRDRDTKAEENRAALGLRGATLAENQRYHQDRVDVEREKMTARLGGGPGGRDFQFDHKYNAWLAVHKDDHEGALDYANGHKKMDPAEQHKAALTLAQQQWREDIRAEAQLPAAQQKLSRMTREQKQKYIDDLAEDNRKRLKGESAYQPPPYVRKDPDIGKEPQSAADLGWKPKPQTPPPQATPPQAPGAPLSRPVVPGTPAPPRPSPAPPADMGPMPGANAATPPQAAPAKPPAAPPVGKTPPIPSNIGPPPVPGATPVYSQSRKSWSWVTPDGKRLPVASQSAPNTQVPAIP